jgi:hypothetical protein
MGFAFCHQSCLTRKTACIPAQARQNQDPSSSSRLGSGCPRKKQVVQKALPEGCVNHLGLYLGQIISLPGPEENGCRSTEENARFALSMKLIMGFCQEAMVKILSIMLGQKGRFHRTHLGECIIPAVKESAGCQGLWSLGKLVEPGIKQAAIFRIRTIDAFSKNRGDPLRRPSISMTSPVTQGINHILAIQ